MDENAVSIPPQQTPPTLAPAQSMVCPRCHFPVKPEYYFCPNCGTKLEEVSLSTTIGAQIWLYFYSIILMPATCYLIYSGWKGIRYFKSKDPKAHQMGIIAIILLVVSIAIIVWSTFTTIVWIQGYLQQSLNDAGSFGSF